MNAMAGNFTVWFREMERKNCPECTFTGQGKTVFKGSGKDLRTKAVRKTKSPCKMGVFPVQSDIVKGWKESLLRTLFFAGKQDIRKTTDFEKGKNV